MIAKSNLEEKHFSSKDGIKSITRFGLSECVMIIWLYVGHPNTPMAYVIYIPPIRFDQCLLAMNE